MRKLLVHWVPAVGYALMAYSIGYGVFTDTPINPFVLGIASGVCLLQAVDYVVQALTES
jgi:hypothetical protein